MANLCEHYHHLDLSWLRRRKLLTPGTPSSINWTTGGHPSGSIRIEVGMDAVHLIYRTRSRSEDWHDMREVVRFRETGTRFGGRRRWFACPRCGRACRVLFGGGRFLCRSCHGLQYKSQYESAWSRATSRAQKIRTRLHGSANLLERFPPRPKHMRHRTYQRLRALDRRLMGVSTICLAEFAQRLRRRIGPAAT
jgi:hypothetical protein